MDAELLERTQRTISELNTLLKTAHTANEQSMAELKDIHQAFGAKDSKTLKKVKTAKAFVEGMLRELRAEIILLKPFIKALRGTKSKSAEFKRIKYDLLSLHHILVKRITLLRTVKRARNYHKILDLLEGDHKLIKEALGLDEEAKKDVKQWSHEGTSVGKYGVCLFGTFVAILILIGLGVLLFKGG